MTKKSKPPFLRRNFKKLLLLSLLIAGAAAFLLYQPAVKIFKSSRAESLVEEAEEYAEAEDWEEVKRTALASMQNKESFAALRLIAKSYVETKDAGTLQILYSLFTHEEAESSDRAMALEEAMNLRDFKGASEMIEMLSEEDHKIPKIRYQMVKWLLQTGRAPKAIEFADEETDFPKDPALNLLLAQGVAASGLEGAREVTTDRLIRVMNGEDRETALKALDYLPALQDSWIYSPLAKGALKRFGDDPDLSVRQLLVLEFLKIGLDKSKHEKIVEDAVANYQDDNLVELVGWLKRIGKFDTIVKLTDSEDAQSDSGLFSARVGALEKLGLWEQLEEELIDPPVALPDPMLYSAQAIAAFQNKNNLKFIQSWEDAVAAAQRDLQRNWFPQLALSAKRLNDTDRQMDALAQGIIHPLGNPPNSSKLTALFQWVLDRGETERLLKITQTLLKSEPNTPLLINNLVYLKSIHKRVDAEDVVKLEKLVKAFPNQKGLLNTMAIALLQTKKPQAALDALIKISADPAKLSPSGQAVYANALHDLGREEEAFEIADKIKWKDLNQAEITLLAIARPQ